MVFSDTTTKLGLIQNCEMRCFGDNNYGIISGTPDLLLQFTERINRAQDRFTLLAMTADGRWQWSDNNNTDLDIAKTDIVSGQRDYTFALEHLEIEKVLILPSATDTNYRLIYPIDQDDESAIDYLENTSTNTGIPGGYDKRGNSLIFDKTPNYSATNGIEIYFKRGASYFVYTDQSKVPGFASIFHGFLSLHASANYAIDRGFPIAKNLFDLLQREEDAITDYFGHRNRDEVGIIVNDPIIYE